MKAYETALNASDTNAVMTLYSSNPVFTPPAAPALVGREAVSKGYEHVFSILKLSIRFTIHETETFGDTAWGRTSSSGKTKILSSGREVQEGNNELYIFKRENGGWKIHRYCFAEIYPTPSE
jgi:ketosteroid isomerase-like protein